MNKEHFEALIIDSELGELSDEVSSLLESYLDTHTEAKMEAESIRNTLDMTKTTVMESPELFRDSAPARIDFLGRVAGLLTILNLRNTAVALLVVLSAAAGYFLNDNIPSGTSNSPSPVVESSQAAKKSNIKKPLWANYQIDDGGNPVLLLASTPSGSE